MEKQDEVEYAVPMNNREWYSQVMQFCQTAGSCTRCPYHLLAQTEFSNQTDDRPCFSNPQSLAELEAWLMQRHDLAEDDESDEADDDHQWLKELLKRQFDEEDEAFFLDEELL